MKLSYNYTIILLFIFLIGCSSTADTSKNNEKSLLPYSVPKNITSNNIQITIPNNWIEIKDNRNHIFEIWLINSKANAVISFIPINLSSELNFEDISSKLRVIQELLISNKKNSGKEFSIIQEELISSSYEMKSIKYLIDDQYQNSIIFGKNETFYECLAYFHKEYQPTSDEISDLFETQKQIASDLIFK